MTPQKPPAQLHLAKPRPLIWGLCSLLLNATAFAQAQPPADESKKDTAGRDEVVVLSPFIVDASQDRGYQATSTLAGSRINTELKNLSAPITVVTSEFLKDISATGINDILAFTVNTEGTRDFTATDGGFSDSIAGNLRAPPASAASPLLILLEITSGPSVVPSVLILTIWTRLPSAAGPTLSWQVSDLRAVLSTTRPSSRRWARIAQRSRIGLGVIATAGRALTAMWY